MSNSQSILDATLGMLQSVERPVIIAAFSGGPDSTALLHALHTASRHLSSRELPSPRLYAAHCNFRLRGDESQRDKDFALRLAQNLNIPCFTIEFDTNTYCKQNRLSIEMGARQLRHGWFRELCTEHNALLATGHNADDNAETMLLNMLRGSGVRGLKGMLPHQGHIIRPLLQFGREQIMQYLTENNLEYVTDSTNLESDYRRNFLRNEIIPLLQTRWPGAKRGLATTLSCLADDYAVIEQAVDRSLPSPERILTWDALREFASPRLLLLRHFGTFGLTPDIAREIQHHIPNPRPGAVWHIHDNNNKRSVIRATTTGLTITPDDDERKDGKDYKCDFSADEGYRWSEPVDVTEDVLNSVMRMPLTECALPCGEENYIWCRPDKDMRIRPLGMRGSKRVRDVLREAGLTGAEAEKLRILCRRSDYSPVWIPGIKRASTDLITSHSKTIYIVSPI